MGFYATIPTSLAPDTIRKRRLDHIVWPVEKDPKCQLFAYAGAAWKIFVKGDALADPEGFERVKAAWLRQVADHRNDEGIKGYAAASMQSGDPEIAARLLRELKLTRAVGSLYASQILGVVALEYQTGDPSAIDESIRDSAYGKQLYADGRTHSDYTTLSRELLARARSLDPTLSIGMP